MCVYGRRVWDCLYCAVCALVQDSTSCSSAALEPRLIDVMVEIYHEVGLPGP